MHGLKQFFFLLSLVLLPSAFSSSPKSIEIADQQYEKKLYQSALQDYLEILKDSKNQNFDKALLRAVQCQAFLSKYNEAVQLLEQIQLPPNKLTRYQALLLQIELSQTIQMLSLRTFESPEREIQNTDVTARSPKEWRKKIDQLYETLLKDSNDLKNTDLAAAADVVDRENADLELTPTLYDFVVRLRIENLSQDYLYQDEIPSALEIWQSKPAKPEAAPAAKAQALLLEAKTKDNFSKRNSARENWALQQILLPIKWSDKIRVGQDLSNESQKRLKVFAEESKSSRVKADAIFQLATLLNNQEKYSEAVSNCQKIKDFPKSNSTVECERLVGEIKNPTLQIETSTEAPPATHSVSVQTRNLQKVFFSIFKISEPLKLNNPKGFPQNERDNQSESFDFLRRVNSEIAEKYISTQKPFKQWQVATDDNGSYLVLEKKISPPQLEAGFYLVVASNDSAIKPKQSLVSAAYLNVTDFFLFNRVALEGNPEEFLSQRPAKKSENSSTQITRQEETSILQTLALDGKSGLPLEGVKVQVRRLNHFDRVEQKANHLSAPTVTSHFGELKTSLRLNQSPGVGTHGVFDIFAERDSRFAFLQAPLSFYFSQESPLRIYVETDRPICRPGQTVKGSVTVFERIPYGYRAVDSGKPIELKVRNPNVEFLSKTISTNSNGSAAFEFTIPKSGLLGHYNVSATYSNQDVQFGNSAWAGFAVEEYKRPEFEIKLGDEKSLSYKSVAEISGLLKYYFGGAVADGTIKYKIEQTAHIPWFWSWYWRPMPPPRLVAEGTIKSNSEGKFKFSFTPEELKESSSSEESSDLPSVFQISLEARDTGGRTITATQTLYADAKEFNIALSSDQGFFRENGEVKIKTLLLDLSGKEYSGKIDYEVFELGQPADPTPKKNSEKRFQNRREPSQAISLLQLYSETKPSRTVKKGSLTVKAHEKSELTLSTLPEGVYRTLFTTKDRNQKKVEAQYVFLVVGNLEKLSKLGLPSMALPERTEYQPKETALVLVGASSLSSPLYLDILKSHFVLESKVIGGKGLRLVQIPIADKHSRGFGVHWQTAQNFEIFEGQTQIDVPAKSKILHLDLVHPKFMQPGQSQNWNLTIQDSKRNKVTAEASLKVFDRSLEYYRTSDTLNLFEALYHSTSLQVGFQNSSVTLSGTSIPVESGPLSAFYKLMNQWMPPPKDPTLFIRGFGFEMQRSSKFAMSDSYMAGSGAGRAAMSERAMLKGAEISADKAPRTVSEASSQPPAVATRLNFAETAFFNSQIAAPQGLGLVHFKIPEQLTSWKIHATAHTKDGKVGNLEAESVTRKDLMTRIEIPRFLRERDQSVITSVIHNESEQPLTGKVKLEILLNKNDQTKKFGLENSSLDFKVNPHSQTSVSWKTVAPIGVSTYKIRVTAIAKSKDAKQLVLTDGEQRELPVLPSGERLIESTFAALNGNVQKNLTLADLFATDPTHVGERIDVKIEPQLALSVLNSLPFLIQYSCYGTEQIINRYVPLAIVQEFFNKFPELAEAAAKIPKRKTISPAWNSDDPQRLIHLAESPWLQKASGVESEYPLIDLLNPQLVKLEKERSQADLSKRQLPSGGFPWYPGGKEDLFITLNVLEGFAQAKLYRLEIPKELTDRALGYVMQEMPRLLTAERRDLANLMYGSFILSSFDNTFSHAKERTEFIKKAMQFADENSKKLSPLGLAYAAWIYHRLNDQPHAESYLSRALDGSASNELSGVYWTPEKNSWFWYNDSVDKHAFFLRLLLEMHPEDKKISGMVRWLLFNRKGNEWQSTRSSAAAIYSLLDFMKSTGALNKSDDFEIRWGDKTEKIKIDPLNWLDKPISFAKIGSDIKPEDQVVKIQKQGPGLTFASMTRIYSSEKIQSPLPPDSESVLKIERKYFLRSSLNGEAVLRPLQSGDKVHVGDQIEARIKINTNSQFEYLHLKDPRGAGFESEVLTSGWAWDSLARYEEPRDSMMNFFISWLPHGEYVLRHRMRATVPGTYRIGSALLQSTYAPEFTARSSGMILSIE